MQTVALPGTNLTVSRIGFGSAGLMGRLGRKESLRLLEVAHDSGITHFDTARSYGYGEAESVVGAFLARRREQVTVTTKLGIAAPARSRTLQAAKAVGRLASRHVPLVRPLLRRPARAVVTEGEFSPAQARASLETSLKELGLETVDLLLLHEIRPDDLHTDGLRDFLEQSVTAGKVRYWGIATDVTSTARALDTEPGFCRVIQIAYSGVDPSFEYLPALDGAVITHSAIRMGLDRLMSLLSNEVTARAWSDRLGLDCQNRETVARLLLAEAMRANTRGAVLFSSTQPGSIRANAQLGADSPFSPDQLQEFARLARGASADRGTRSIS